MTENPIVASAIATRLVRTALAKSDASRLGQQIARATRTKPRRARGNFESAFPVAAAG
jgi:hypothetical protein